MAVPFNPLIGAILLSVELLLFELKPCSLIPVALACAVAVALRSYFLGSGPLFPRPEDLALDSLGLISARACGSLAGIVSSILAWSVYVCEEVLPSCPFIGCGGRSWTALLLASAVIFNRML
jgi:H+/Cl- antiporter ClcA